MSTFIILVFRNVLNCFKVYAAGPSTHKLGLCSSNLLSTEFKTIKFKLHSKIANDIFNQKKMYVFEFNNVCIKVCHVFMTLDIETIWFMVSPYLRYRAGVEPSFLRVLTILRRFSCSVTIGELPPCSPFPTTVLIKNLKTDV